MISVLLSYKTIAPYSSILLTPLIPEQEEPVSQSEWMRLRDFRQ